MARLVLVGDTQQLRAVDAGQPFRQLQQAGMTTATMDDILRQKNPALRQAVLAALAGEPAEAVEMLGNGIVEVEHDELAGKAAETWLALDGEARDGTLLLAPTHALREEINRTVRDALADEGVLRGRTLTIDRLVNLGMTRAERGDARNYREGDELVFNQDLLNYRLRKDEILTVTGVDRDRVTLLHPDGGPRTIRPAGPIRYRFDVYETRPIEIRAGDRIRWTRNDRARTLINGEKAEVTEIAGGRVRLALEDGRAVSLAEDDPQLRHIDHAWSATVHGAQGSTSDRVIAVLDSSHRALTDQSTFYVEISRARYDAVVLTDNLEQLVKVLMADTGERPTAWEAAEERFEPDPERLARALKEKAPVWTPSGEWSALEARARSEGTVLFLVEGYGQLIGRTRMLARTPDLPAEIREVTDGLLAYDLACRDHGGAADEFLGLLEDHAGKRRGLDGAAEAERRAVAGLDDYPDWREMAARLAGNAAAVIAAADGAAGAIERRLEDLRGLLARDDASLAFETRRIDIEARAGAANTIPFHCEGYDDLVRQARDLIPLTAPDTYMRGAAEAVIADHDACEKRHEEIGALRDAAAACLVARGGLEALAEGQLPTGLEGYAAWSADCAAAEERWNAIRDDPDTWQPHLDRRKEDAERIEADLGRLAGLRGCDAAWSELIEERPAIAEEARARGCDAFDLDRWEAFVEKARALAEWPDLPEAAAEAAARVLEYDTRCRTVRDFAAGVGTHGERRNALEEEAALWRSEDPGISIVDLAGYAPLSSFARELAQMGETIRNDEPAHAPRIARLPGGSEGFAAALRRLDWHRPLDRFVDVTGRIAEARKTADEAGILAFHAPGYGAAMDDARDLAEDRALEEAAARARLRAELDEHAARQAEWLRIERLLRELDAIEKERRKLERDAEREDVPLDRLPEWEGWTARHGEFAVNARAALADAALAGHWTSRPDVRERIENGIAGLFEARDVARQPQDRTPGREQDRDVDLAAGPSVEEDYPVRCRRDFVVGDLLCWTEPALPDRLPGSPAPQGAPGREVRFEAALAGREAALDERDDRCAVEIIRRSDGGICGTAHPSFSMLAGGGCTRPFWDDEEERRREAEEQWRELQRERQALVEQQQREQRQRNERFQVMTLSRR